MTDAKKPEAVVCPRCGGCGYRDPNGDEGACLICNGDGEVPEADGIRAAAEEMAELIHAGSWAFIPLKALCEKFIRREVERERERIEKVIKRTITGYGTRPMMECLLDRIRQGGKP